MFAALCGINIWKHERQLWNRLKPELSGCDLHLRAIKPIASCQLNWLGELEKVSSRWVKIQQLPTFVSGIPTNRVKIAQQRRLAFDEKFCAENIFSECVSKIEQKSFFENVDYLCSTEIKQSCIIELTTANVFSKITSKPVPFIINQRLSWRFPCCFDHKISMCLGGEANPEAPL